MNGSSESLEAGSCGSRAARVPVLVPFVVWVVYLLLGSLLFVSLEGPNEKSSYEEKLEEIQEFLNGSCISETMNSSVVRQLSEDIMARLHPYKDVYHWNFVGGVHFCLTVISTIGYGTLAPATQMGRVACIFYGFFGILINVVLMSRVGRMVTTAIDRIYTRLVRLNQRVTNCMCPGRTCNSTGVPAEGRTSRYEPVETNQNHARCKVPGDEAEQMHMPCLESVTCLNNESEKEIQTSSLGKVSLESLSGLDNLKDSAETKMSSKSLYDNVSYQEKTSLCQEQNGSCDRELHVQGSQSGHDHYDHRYHAIIPNEQVKDDAKSIAPSKNYCCACCPKTKKAPVSFLILCVVAYINIASVLFFKLVKKQLSYVDMLYLQFITFSTIGFGDAFSILADIQSTFIIEPAAFIAISVVNVLFGMAAISTVVSYVTETNRVDEARKELCYQMDKLKKATCGTCSKRSESVSTLDTLTKPAEATNVLI